LFLSGIATVALFRRTQQRQDGVLAVGNWNILFASWKNSLKFNCCVNDVVLLAVACSCG
jgi:hypothetical protein